MYLSKKEAAYITWKRKKKTDTELVIARNERAITISKKPRDRINMNNYLNAAEQANQ